MKSIPQYQIKSPLLVGLAIIAAISVSTAALLRTSNTADAAPGGAQSDSAQFKLWLAGGDHQANDTVYCGVKRNAEPYTLSVVATNPPQPIAGGNQNDGPFSPSHDGAGWFVLALQNDTDNDGTYYNIPYNDSLAFQLTLGGRPQADQMIRIMSPPKGDDSGNGAPITGIATVKAQSGATDPFNGDGRSDNFCVTIDANGAGSGEYTEGEISTTMPVPDGWVRDGNGADGGVLLTLPH